VSLVLSPGGERLAKRTRPVSVGDLRQRGMAPEEIVGALAASAGLVAAGVRATPADLIAEFTFERLRREPTEIGSLSA